MAIKGIAANIPIKGVKFVEYYYSSEVDEALVTTHFVTVVLNKHIYGGRFAGSTETDAFNKAKELVKGCLVKSGCFRPDTGLNNIDFRKYGFPASPPLTDNTPNAINWLDLSFSQEEAVPNNVAQLTGIDSSITLSITNTGAAGTIYYRASNTSFNTINFANFPIFWTAVVSGGTFTVANNQYIGFACISDVADTTMNLTVRNTTDGNAILDTFIAEYTSVGQPL